MNSAATAQPFALACTARIQEVKLRARICATARGPGGVGETGALRCGVQRRETHRARSRHGTAALQCQGPELHASRPVGLRGLPSPEKSVRLRVEEAAQKVALSRLPFGISFPADESGYSWSAQLLRFPLLANITLLPCVRKPRAARCV